MYPNDFYLMAKKCPQMLQFIAFQAINQFLI